MYGRHIHTIPPDVLEDLLQYDWPGNIRELRNTIERLVIFSTDGEVKREYLPANIYAGDTNADPGPDSLGTGEEINGSLYQARLDDYERNLLQQLLEAAGGNKLAVAKQLGISRATLYNKLKRLQL
ncbi:helix-turn-helix domain-containing protein [Paenibacillus sp. JTLBN-2024]